MGWFFPEASEKTHLQQQIQQMHTQVMQIQQQMHTQAALIARMNTTLIHLRAENAVLSNAGAFLDKKVERFQAAAATLMRNPGSCPLHAMHLEAIECAASNIRQDNYASVIGAPDVRSAISALEMWADNPYVEQVLLAAFILFSK
jgi:hypothetical protein